MLRGICVEGYFVANIGLINSRNFKMNGAARIIADLSYEINSAVVHESLGLETLEGRGYTPSFCCTSKLWLSVVGEKLVKCNGSLTERFDHERGPGYIRIFQCIVNSLQLRNCLLFHLFGS